MSCAYHKRMKAATAAAKKKVVGGKKNAPKKTIAGKVVRGVKKVSRGVKKALPPGVAKTLTVIAHAVAGIVIGFAYAIAVDYLIATLFALITGTSTQQKRYRDAFKADFSKGGKFSSNPPKEAWFKQTSDIAKPLIGGLGTLAFLVFANALLNKVIAAKKSGKLTEAAKRMKAITREVFGKGE